MIQGLRAVALRAVQGTIRRLTAFWKTYSFIHALFCWSAIAQLGEFFHHRLRSLLPRYDLCLTRVKSFIR